MNIVHYLAVVQSVTTKKGPRHLVEVGALLGGLGALLIMVGGALGLGWIPGGGSEGRAERIAYIVGGLFLGLGFLLFLLGVRGGFGSVTVR